MRHHLEAGQLIYDVGAEEGDMPALWASWGLDVVLIEPNPKVWPCIRMIWEANDLKPYAWWVGFLAEYPWQYGDFDKRFGDSGWPEWAYGELIPGHGFQHLVEHSDVTPAMTLDGLAELTYEPDVITMDVEGAEFRVLLGARKVLTYTRPKVFVSIHPEFMKYYHQTPDDLHAFMDSMDYESKFLTTDHEEHWMFLPK